MDKHRIHTDNAPAAIGPYSQGIRIGNLVFTAGQMGYTPAGEPAGEDIATQTEQVLNNLSAILEAAGTDMAHVVKTTVFLQSMGDFATMNAIYARYFTEPFPARTTVEAAALPRNVLVEIECVAVLPEG
ncbi:MAG: RidA family protein [Anaerolineae bacterium]|nr:RidA family protein [Promineifilum sp.]MCZ2115523.1 RidA family protein [Anaerolineae bacterium]HNS39582.1 RidA family protein [Promineifilum sp.]